MADNVSVLEISDTTGLKYTAKLTNISDGTGESLVEKITAANETFMTEDGNRKIARINWSINTLNRNGAVEILWEGATNATACIIRPVLVIYDPTNNKIMQQHNRRLLSTKNLQWRQLYYSY